MTSRPAAPESETPETDVLDLQCGHRKEIFDAYRELARSLERRLSLVEAQIQQARDFIIEQSAENIGGGEKPIEFLLASYKLMARERSLAQTEIKGHVRVVDDLRIELEREKDDFFKAQSRIAELEAGRDFQSARIDGIIKEESMAQNVLKKRCKEFEKLLCDAQENLVWCGGSTDFGWGGKAQVGYDKGPRATIAAIDAALKSRA